MKKFEYKLEKILKVKEKLEIQAKIDYGNANEILLKETEKLEHLKNTYNEYQLNLKKSLISKINILEVSHCESALKYIKEKINKQQQIVVEAERELEIRRLKLVETMKEKKVFDILKEKDYEEYKKELKKEEIKEIDEFISFQYNKKEGF